MPFAFGGVAEIPQESPKKEKKFTFGGSQDGNEKKSIKQQRQEQYENEAPKLKKLFQENPGAAFSALGIGAAGPAEIAENLDPVRMAINAYNLAQNITGGEQAPSAPGFFNQARELAYEGLSQEQKKATHVAEALGGLIPIPSGRGFKPPQIAQEIPKTPPTAPPRPPGTPPPPPMPPPMGLPPLPSTRQPLPRQPSKPPEPPARTFQQEISDIVPAEAPFSSEYEKGKAIRRAAEEAAPEVPEVTLYRNVPSKGEKAVPISAERIEQKPIREPEKLPEPEKKLADEIAPKPFADDVEAAQQIRKEAQEIREPIKAQFNEEFDALRDEYRTIEAPQAPLASSMDKFVQEAEGTLTRGASAAENKVINAAKELRSNLYEITPDGEIAGLRPVSIENLIKTKRSLGDVADFEIAESSFKSAFKHLYHEVDEAIKETLRNANPDAYDRFVELNGRYRRYKDVFENDRIAPLFEPQNTDYHTIFREMLHPDTLTAAEKILSHSPTGEAALSKLKRDYFTMKIGEKELSPREAANLKRILGKKYDKPVEEFMADVKKSKEKPVPAEKAAAQRPKNAPKVEISKPFQRPAQGEAKSLKGRAEVSGVTKAQQSQKETAGILKNKSPEQIARMADDLSGFDDLEKILGKSPEGRKLLEQVKEQKAIDILYEGKVHAADAPKPIEKILRDREAREFLKKTLGEEKLKKLDNVVAHFKDLEKKLEAQIIKEPGNEKLKVALKIVKFGLNFVPGGSVAKKIITLLLDSGVLNHLNRLAAG